MMKTHLTILRSIHPTILGSLGLAWTLSSPVLADAAPNQEEAASAAAQDEGSDKAKKNEAEKAEAAAGAETSPSARRIRTAQEEEPAPVEEPPAPVEEPAPAMEEPAPGPETALPEESMRRMIQEEMGKAYKPFEYHGYMRSGFGVNGKGGDQDAFQAPGTPVKYRLGNETETYGEMIFVNNWLKPENSSDKLFFKTEILLTFVTFNNSNFDAANDLFTIREAFAQAGGVFEAKPDLKFWAGQRYYHRHDTHIDDFFYLSMSGYGGGFEDLKLGSDAAGKLAGGYFGASVGDTTVFSDNGRPVKHVLDLRLEDVALAGQATFWVAGSRFQGGDADPDIGGSVAIPSSTGFAVGALHTIPDFMGGFNKLVLQYGTGPLTDYDIFFRTPGDAPNDNPTSVNDEDAWRFRIIEALVVQPSPMLSLMGTALVQMTDYGSDENAKESWYSAGVRPVVHFTDYATLAFEAGFDYVDSEFTTNADGELGSAGYLTKLTVAPQIQAGRNFWGRPAIRAYFTYAFWSEDFEGRVGGPTYANDSAGIGAGLQAEAWW